MKFVCRNKEHFSNMHLHGFFFRSESGCNFKNKATLGFLIIHYFDVLSFFLSWNPLMEKQHKFLVINYSKNNIFSTVFVIKSYLVSEAYTCYNGLVDSRSQVLSIHTTPAKNYMNNKIIPGINRLIIDPPLPNLK